MAADAAFVIFVLLQGKQAIVFCHVYYASSVSFSSTCVLSYTKSWEASDKVRSLQRLTHCKHAGSDSNILFMQSLH